MSVFTIKIPSAKSYLGAISGITRLTPTETDVLASIIEFMQSKNLHVIDDLVKQHVINTYKFNPQTYHNMLYIFRKKKLLVHSHRKTELKPLLLPGTILEIVFEGPRSVLEDFNAPETSNPTADERKKPETKVRKHKRKPVSAGS